MNTPESQDRDRLQHLANRMCDGTISPEEIAELEALLNRQPELQTRYLQILSLHAELLTRYRTGSPGPRETGDEDSAADFSDSIINSDPVMPANSSGNVRTEQSRSRWPMSRALQFAVAAAATLLVLAGVATLRSRDTSAGPNVAEVQVERPQEPAFVAPAFVATVRASTQPLWLEDGKALSEGDRVPAQALALKGGQAELVFDSGVRLVLEGPANLRLDSSNAAFLTSGRLVAHVPESGWGFRVDTPTSRLVDRGTDFGVIAEDSGATEVHVFRGQVDLQYEGQKGSAKVDAQGVKELVMLGRQARRIENLSEPGRSIKFSKEIFERLESAIAEPLEWRVADGGNGHFYQLVVCRQPITWHQAAQNALSSSHGGWAGHLASITSAEEDSFVIEKILKDSSQRGVWMGLTDVLREGFFKWVTGEKVTYTNWATWPEQQPDNFKETLRHGGEDYGIYSRFVNSDEWKWNDLSIDSIHETVSAYLVEYEPPRDDFPSGAVAHEPLMWSADRGGNDHAYQLVLALNSTSCETDRDNARSFTHNGVSGDLVALDTPGEFEFISNNVLRICGINDNLIGLQGSLLHGDLKWTNGRKVEFVDVQPPRLPADQVYGMIVWHHDHWEVQARALGSPPEDWHGYIVEYDFGHE